MFGPREIRAAETVTSRPIETLRPIKTLRHFTTKCPMSGEMREDPTVEVAGCSPSTTDRVLRDHADLWARAASHPLVVGTAAQRLPSGVFERFMLSEAYFLRNHRRLMTVMAMQAPASRVSAMIFANARVVDRELAVCSEYVRESGLSVDDPPTPLEMDYSSFCVAMAANGWNSGITVMCAVEWLFLESWASTARALPMESPFRPIIDLWVNPGQVEYVAKLRQLLDEVTYTDDVSRNFAEAIEFEVNVWDEVLQTT